MHDPASALAEARALAGQAAAEVWGLPPPQARERAADVMRLLLGGRVPDGIRAIAGLEAPDPAAARRIVGLVRARGRAPRRRRGPAVAAARLAAHRRGDRSSDRRVRGPRSAAAPGVGSRSSQRWSSHGGTGPRRSRSRRASAPADSITLRELRSLGRPGPREVLVAPLPLPHLAPLLWHSAALVTSGGTSGAHLFEVARSLGVPAVIGADADALGESGSLVAVDGDTGRVSILSLPAATILPSTGSGTDDGRPVRFRGGGPEEEARDGARRGDRSRLPGSGSGAGAARARRGTSSASARTPRRSRRCARPSRARTPC